VRLGLVFSNVWWGQVREHAPLLRYDGRAPAPTRASRTGGPSDYLSASDGLLLRKNPLTYVAPVCPDGKDCEHTRGEPEEALTSVNPGHGSPLAYIYI
jgi:hypothetical protein